MIYLRLEWQSNNQFLFIFEFHDEYPKPNIRFKSAKNGYDKDYHNWIEWAPTHVELGMMAELLSFANRINGSKQRIVLLEVLTQHSTYVKKALEGSTLQNNPSNYIMEQKTPFELKILQWFSKCKRSVFYKNGDVIVGFEVNQALINFLRLFD